MSTSKFSANCKVNREVRVLEMKEGTLFYNQDKSGIMMRTSGLSAVCVHVFDNNTHIKNGPTKYWCRVGGVTDQYDPSTYRELVEPEACVELRN